MSPMDRPAERPTVWGRYQILLLGLVLGRGMVLLCVLPPFEGWDEYQHVGYVVHLIETGRRPTPGATAVPRSLLAAASAFPQPRHALDQMGGWGAAGYGRFWTEPGRANLGAGDVLMYQAQHGPLYYRLAAPIFKAAGGVANLRRSIGALRLANLLITVAAVAIALRALRRIARDERVAAAVGTLIAAHPLFLINGVRVANDALGVLLATVAVAGFLTAGPRRWVARCAGLGVLIGLAVLAKEVHFGLVPFAAVGWLLAVVRDRPRPARAIAAGLALAAGFLVVTQGELRANLARHGGLTAAQEASAGGQAGPGLLETARGIDWAEQAARLWLREGLFVGGWTYLQPSRKHLHWYRTAIAVGLLGWTCLLLRRNRREPGPIRSHSATLGCVAVILGYSAALAYHVALSDAAWGRSTTNPWYACAAVPWLLVLVGAGGMAWPLGRGKPALPLATAGLCLASEALVIWGLMVPTYAGGAMGREALSRLASLQHPTLGMATLVAATAVEIACVAMILLAWMPRRDKSRAADSLPRPWSLRPRRRSLPIRGSVAFETPAD